MPRGTPDDATRARLERIAWLLDSSIRVPGTRFRIGLDPLIGLFPVLGDLIGVLLSSYIVLGAARLGAPRRVLVRMLLNLGIEGVLGAVPLAGDVFDAAWKANQRNVRLLDDWIGSPAPSGRPHRLLIVLGVLGLVAILTLAGIGLVALLRALLGGA